MYVGMHVCEAFKCLKHSLKCGPTAKLIPVEVNTCETICSPTNVIMGFG